MWILILYAVTAVCSEMTPSQSIATVADVGITSGAQTFSFSYFALRLRLTFWVQYRCMGFHSIQDKRIPQRFLCFTCSLERDENWAIVRLQPWCPELLNKHAQLALFRYIMITSLRGASDGFGAGGRSSLWRSTTLNRARLLPS